MNRFGLVIVVPALMAGAAHADPLSSLYGNTVAATTADGKTSKGYVNADMTWEQIMSDGTVVKGTYSWRDATTACFVQSDPPPRADSPPNCTKVEEHKIGDTWTATDPKNQTTSYTLSAGR